MNARQSLKDWHDTLDAYGPSAPIRRYLTDPEAVALAKELKPAECRHPALLGAALDAIAKVPPMPKSENPNAILAWAQKSDAALRAFWNAFEGQEVEGVEIMRRVIP